jgi:COPII coat assembly protein SEC16
VIEEAVRTALLGPPSESLTMIGGAPAPAFGVPAFYPGDSTQPGRDSSAITYHVRASSLDRLQELLIRGERRQAYQFALDEKLWSHALLISSSLDKEAWKEVAHEFIKSELGLSSDTQDGTGKESLRLAYGLFAGDGPSASALILPLLPKFAYFVKQ